MRWLIDFGEPDAWVVESVTDDLVILAPTQPVAGIAKERIRFIIERCCNPENACLRYSFQGFFSLGEGMDFTGEYTFRFEIDLFGETCLVMPVSDFSLSEFEVRNALSLVKALCNTLPRNLIMYGALHDTDWVADKWDAATPENIEIFRHRLL